jgi:hypothetical protein
LAQPFSKRLFLKGCYITLQLSLLNGDTITSGNLLRQ